MVLEAVLVCFIDKRIRTLQYSIDRTRISKVKQQIEWGLSRIASSVNFSGETMDTKFCVAVLTF